jgi:CheY-like chemotaxis protein
MSALKFVAPQNIVILLVDDSADDVQLIQRALSQAKITNAVSVVRDGEEALAYLNGTAQFADRKSFPFPHLVLLDLKMPRMGGLELLQIIRARPEWTSLRVIVLTSSDQVYDLNKAYQLGAASFLMKPNDFLDFATLIRTLSTFWLGSTVRMIDNSTRDPDPSSLE